MKRFMILIVLLSLSTASIAQDKPDPAELQRAISALQAQRNQAMDMAAMIEARARGLAEDLVKAQTRIKELESKPEEPKK